MAGVAAAVVVGFGSAVELWRVPVPSLEDGDILIQVDAATLCGTDAHRWAGHMSGEGDEDHPFTSRLSLPYTPGHESCGTIQELAGDAYDLMHRPLKAGNRIISSYPHCGQCYYCAVTRQTTLCHENVSFGHWHPARLLGGCAEYQLFPAAGKCVRVPDNVDSAVAASASCALRTVLHGFEQVGEIAGYESVLILGAGPLGLYAAAVAITLGVGSVTLIGAPEPRLHVAAAWGVQQLLNLDLAADVHQRVEWVRDQTSGRGADIVFNCASSHALTEALQMVRPGGRLVQLGVSGGAAIQIPPLHFFRGVRIFCPVMAEARHFYGAIEFVSRHGERFDFSRIISNSYPLEKTGDALRGMAEFREVKPLIRPHKV